MIIEYMRKPFIDAVIEAKNHTFTAKEVFEAAKKSYFQYYIQTSDMDEIICNVYSLKRYTLLINTANASFNNELQNIADEKRILQERII